MGCRGSAILRLVLLAWALLLCTGGQGGADGLPAVGAGEPLVILFAEAQKTLSAADRAAIQRLMAAHQPGPEKKVLVLGYSDDRGNPQKNMRLSQQRAEAVRKEILGASGVDPRYVMAIGRGAQNPIGDNRRADGRTRNRRVEVYWAQAMDSSGKMIKAPPTISPNVPVMVQDARSLIRQRRLIEAVQLLDRARDQGGEYDSSWQAVYGIAGFYAGMDARIVKQHLGLALEQDPFNQEARDYLGRILAREHVRDGTVSARMGLTERDPIGVTCDAQIHEYLRLFDINPVSKYRARSRPLEAWHCHDRQGRPVVYYFDRSQVYTWAFTAKRSEHLQTMEVMETPPTKGIAPK